MNDSPHSLRIFVSPSVEDCIPEGPLRELAQELTQSSHPDSIELSVVVVSASYLLEQQAAALPGWSDADTRYLVIADVPEPALLRLPSVLGLHKPHLRLHVARDSDAVKRLLIAQMRSAPWEGIIDAYVLGDCLVTVLGDMSIREFPKHRLPKIAKMRTKSFESFELDPSGSFLHWSEGDVHLGASQLLQAVDPMYLTDVEIERYAREKVSLALLDMRHDRGLKQTEIPGLSDRHVRRLENEEIRLSVDAAEKFAQAFGMDLNGFLEELSRRVTELQEDNPTLDGFPSLVGTG